MDAEANFRPFVGVLYRHGARSHHIVEVAHKLGFHLSSKTVMKIVRNAPHWIPKVGRWEKRGLRLLWKNRGLDTRLLTVALCYAAWVNYAQAGLGEMDLDAIASGEKPP